MQPVEKKKKRKVPPRLLMILLAVLAIIIMAAALSFFHLHPKEKPLPIDAASHSEDVMLLNAAQDTLLSIEIIPASGRGYTLMYRDETLSLPEDSAYPIRPSVVSCLLSAAESVSAEIILEDTASCDLSAYGFDALSPRAVIRYQDGAAVTLRFGASLPVEADMVYCMVDHDPHLYAVYQDTYEAFTIVFDSLHPVDNPTIQSDLIDRITLSGDINFSAHYTSGGWIMDLPYSYPLSGAKMDYLLDCLDHLRFSTWVGNESDLPLDSYGLSPAHITLTLDFAATTLTVPDEEGTEQTFSLPESTIRMQLGAWQSDVLIYVLYRGQVMTGTSYTFGFIRNFDVESLCQKNPVSFQTNDLSSISMTLDGQTNSYVVHLVERLQQNGDFETDEYGNILYDIAAYDHHGNAVDQTQFLLWYQSLARLSPAGMLPESWAPEGEPTAQITLVNGDGTQTRHIDFYPFTTVYDAFSVDGTFLYTIRSQWRESLADFPQITR